MIYVTYTVVELAVDLTDELVLTGEVLGLQHKGQVGQFLLVEEGLTLGLDLSLLVLLDDFLIGGQVVLLDGVEAVIGGSVLLGGQVVDGGADVHVHDRVGERKPEESYDFKVKDKDFLKLCNLAEYSHDLIFTFERRPRVPKVMRE